jgi:hypothetical protein
MLIGQANKYFNAEFFSTMTTNSRRGEVLSTKETSTEKINCLTQRTGSPLLVVYNNLSSLR